MELYISSETSITLCNPLDRQQLDLQLHDSADYSGFYFQHSVEDVHDFLRLEPGICDYYLPFLP